MRKWTAFLLVTVLILSVALTSCADSSDSDAKLSFSAYYKNAIGFDEYEPLLQDFYALVQTAYNACDKKDPASFLYDETAFIDLHLRITDIFGASLDVKTSELSDPEFDRKAYDATSNAKDIYYDFYACISNLRRDIDAGNAPDNWSDTISEALEQARTAYSAEK